MNISISDIIISIIFIFGMGIFMYGLMWASDRENELGIDGMSSSRILVKDELEAQ